MKKLKVFDTHKTVKLGDRALVSGLTYIPHLDTSLKQHNSTDVYTLEKLNVYCTTIWNILFMAPIIKMIVNVNLLWSEFVETMRHFDLLVQISVTHRLSELDPDTGERIRQPMCDQDLS